MTFVVWIALAVAAGAMFEATNSKKYLEKRINDLEVEVELLKFEDRKRKERGSTND